MTIRTSLLAGVAGTVLLNGAFLTGAAAQAIDYSQMEELFGEPVTTSATGSPQKVSDVPANMDIITEEQIRRSGADNIPDVLRYIAGLDVRTYSTGSSDVAVRGYSQAGNPRLLVLVNGRQVYTDDYGWVHWDSIPVQMPEIRQIEVIRGPNTALFGFNAASGVINIITYDPLLDNRNVVQLRGGTQNYYGGSAVSTFHFNDKIGVRLSGGGYHASGFDNQLISGQTIASEHSPHNANINIDTRFKLAPNITASLEATAIEQQAQQMLPEIGTIGNAFYQTYSVKTGLAADTSYGLINFNAYRNEQRTQATLPIYGVKPNQANVVQIVQLNDTFKWGSDHTFRLGIEYRDNIGTGSLYNHSHIGYSDYAVSGMWKWDIRPDLSWTNSVRFDSLHLRLHGPGPGGLYNADDYNGTTIDEVSFNTGLVYKPTDVDTFRFLIGRGIQAPSLIQLALQSPDRLGTPNLEASKIMNYEIDYDRALPSIHSTFRVAAFYNTVEDVLSGSSGILASDGHIYSGNVGKTSGFGGEIGIKGSNGPWRWNASYSLSTVNDDLTINQGNQLVSTLSFEKASPTSSVIAGVGYTWGKLEADLQARWQSRYDEIIFNQSFAYQRYTIKDYVALSARLAYKVTDNLELSVTGQQLAVDDLRETAGAKIDRRVIFGLTYTY